MSTEHPKTCKDMVAASAAKRSEHRNDNIDKNGANIWQNVQGKPKWYFFLQFVAFFWAVSIQLGLNNFWTKHDKSKHPPALARGSASGQRGSEQQQQQQQQQKTENTKSSGLPDIPLRSAAKLSPFLLSCHRGSCVLWGRWPGFPRIPRKDSAPVLQLGTVVFNTQDTAKSCTSW